jgi:hypothetical protein
MFFSFNLHTQGCSVCLADMIELNEAFPCMMKEAPSSFLPWFLIMLNILLGLCNRAEGGLRLSLFLFSGQEPIYFIENKEKTLRASYDRGTQIFYYMD